MNSHKKVARVLSLLGGAILGLAALGPALAETIQPGTAKAVETVNKLRHAAEVDDNKAAGHSGDDSDVGLYYRDKAQAARELADKLAGGQAVDSDQVSHALDNQGAVRLSPDY